MSDVTIPGISDKYKTNDLVTNLMKIERKPLEAEQARLDSYKLEKESWRRVNQYMVSVRNSARTLFSYNNPFDEKTAESSDESVLTAEASRKADSGEHKIIVEQVATADKFISNSLSKDFTVQAGKYTFKVGKKTVSFNWKGGTLADFTESLNRRGTDVIKASITNVTPETRVWSIESLKTGAENVLSFEDDALALAGGMGIVQVQGKAPETALARSSRDLSPIQQLSSKDVSLKSGKLVVPPQNGVAINLPKDVAQNADYTISLNVALAATNDITEAPQKEEAQRPQFAPSPTVEIGGIVISNIGMNPDLEEIEEAPVQNKIENYTIVYARRANGTENALTQVNAQSGSSTITLNVADYPDLAALVIKNFNTGKTVSVTDIKAYSAQAERDSIPLNPVSMAADAKIKYDGIRMTRSENKIDDIIPDVTLNLESASSKPVTITVSGDNESIKNSIIEFVGNYNRLMAELNILTTIDENVIDEIEYFSDDERADAKKHMGLLQSDFTLRSSKQALQTAVTQPYRIDENKTIQMLSQMGISSKSSTGAGITSSQLRGYLEIDEQKLDDALKNNLKEVKNLFGFDADKDLIADYGVGFSVEQKLASYTQTGGILASKTTSLDTRIKSSESKVEKLEEQLQTKEKELKQKYAAMEGTLNSLQSQSDSISNFTKQNSNSN